MSRFKTAWESSEVLYPERGDALGYLRTEELFEAMRVIRADIAWLAESSDDPISDFGFSKSGEQTFEHWGRKHSLRQMVKMVRLFKPDILIPTFGLVRLSHQHDDHTNHWPLGSSHTRLDRPK